MWQWAGHLAGHLESGWTQCGLPLTPHGVLGGCWGNLGICQERGLRSDVCSMPVGNQASLAVLLAKQLGETKYRGALLLWLLQLFSHSLYLLCCSWPCCTYLTVQIALMFWNNRKKKFLATLKPTIRLGWPSRCVWPRLSAACFWVFFLDHNEIIAANIDLAVTGTTVFVFKGLPLLMKRSEKGGLQVVTIWPKEDLLCRNHRTLFCCCSLLFTACIMTY